MPLDSVRHMYVTLTEINNCQFPPQILDVDADICIRSHTSAVSMGLKIDYIRPFTPETGPDIENRMIEMMGG